MTTRVALRTEKFQLSEHLSIQEMHCHCLNPFCNITLYDDELGKYFEHLRFIIGNIPIRINSGFRCAAHNMQLPNSSMRSQHLVGRAIDMGIPLGVDANVFYNAVKRVGFTFHYLSKDNDFVHADIRPKGDIHG